MTKKDAEEVLAVFKTIDKTIEEMKVVLKEAKDTRNTIKAELRKISVSLEKIDKWL
jgi:hypothetical protein